MGDILDQCTQLPSWAKLVDILKAGRKFGLVFKEGSEYIIINGQINVLLHFMLRQRPSYFLGL
jgi:hypothetical protein